MLTKQCTKCKKNKSLESFTFTLLGKDHKKSICKACIKIINKKNYELKKKKYLDSIQTEDQV